MMIKHTHPARVLRTARPKIWMALMMASLLPYESYAGIVTDTSLGHASQTLSGNMTISQSMGLLSGNNLFHSFQTFNINTGESANFTTSTSGIANVISRVTGGSLSQINGALSLTPCTGCGAPNFFLINPAGVTFGAGASVNVPGAFHVSTADYVKFPDGNFYADLSKASTFSVASPEAFGFLGNSRASIAVYGGAALTTQPGQSISIVAGDVTLNNGTVSTMSGGDIRVAAVGQAASEISFTGALPAANGNLNILNGGDINADTATATTAGSVFVSAGYISVNGKGTGGLGISSNTSSPGNSGGAGNVTVSVADDLSILNGGIISSSTSSSGKAGSVSVIAGSIAIDDPGISTGIYSNTNAGSSGNAGNVAVTATGNLSIVNGGQISSGTYGSGNAGSVTVGAGTLLVEGAGSGGTNTGIYTLADVGSSGQTGNVAVTATLGISLSKNGQISITNNATIADPTVLTPTSLNVTAPTLSSDNPNNITSSSSGNINPASVSINVPSSNYGSSIVTDSSLGQSSQTLVGPNYVIPQSLGLLSGNNLFQSFQTFGLNTGESATFTTSTAGIANLISRVTGGSLSQINGQISLIPCTGCGAPNFFFINPAGVTFGAGASVNVPGAFHVSTADYVKFPDGNFYADLSKASAFSVAVPTAFGFFGNSRASISVNGGAAIAAQPLQPISMVAGDIEINNGTVSTEGNNVRLAAVGQSAEEIGFSGPLPAASGNLSVLNGGIINSNTSGSENPGDVTVSAGSITIDGLGNSGFTGISSHANSGTGNGGSINVAVAGSLSIVYGSEISTDTNSSGNTGSVNVNAGSISIDQQSTYNFTGIESNALTGSGNVGAINVNTLGNLSIVNGGYISSNTYSTGHAGPLTVNAGSININGHGYMTGIRSVTQPSSSSDAGPVIVTTPGNLSIVNGGQILTDTFSNFKGSAGPLTVTAGSISIDGQGYTIDSLGIHVSGTGIFSDAWYGSTGDAGAITVSSTGSLSIANLGLISSQTYMSGHAGTVTVNAGNISIDGQGKSDYAFNGVISLYTGILSNAISNNFDGGTNSDAGTVNVTASGKVSIVNGGKICSDTFGPGNAGTVSVTADSISIDGQGFNAATGTGTGISSNTYQGPGNAGSVTVSVTKNLSIVNGGGISSDTFSFGSAGEVTVSAESINIDGQGYNGYTGISSISSISNAGYIFGNAGSVSVSATGSLSLINGGEISSDTYTPSGIAGKVAVSANSISVAGQGSGISSSAQTDSSGQTGDITVTATDSITLSSGGQLSIANNSWLGDPAVLKQTSLTVTAPSISLDGGQITASNKGNVNAGFVDVSATGTLSVNNGGTITSSTIGTGNAGTVTVNANIITIDGLGSSSITGILTNANLGIGDAGTVNITAASNLSLVNGGQIASATSDQGKAGNVMVKAGTLLVDGTGSSINALADTGSSGQTGSVSVTATDSITISNGGEISIQNNAIVANPGILTTTLLSLSAPIISLDAGQVSAATMGNVKAGDVEVITGNLLVSNGATISTSTSDAGFAGAVTIKAGVIAIDGQGNSGFTGVTSQANTGSSGDAGTIDVTTSGNLAIKNGGAISSSTNSSGNAGIVNVTVAGDLSLINGSTIDSSTTLSGNAGTINVNAGSLEIDRQGNTGFTGISSQAYSGIGNAGTINVTVAGELSIVNGGEISSDTFSKGNAGSLTINAGSIKVDGLGSSTYTGISSTANPDSTGDAGKVTVNTTGELSIFDGGEISTDAHSSGKAGSVTVNAGSISINMKNTIDFTGIASNANAGTGDAGTVTVNTPGKLSIVHGGYISSNTDSFGHAGTIAVNAGSISIDGQGFLTGITSKARIDSSNDAGSIIVTTPGNLSIVNGGQISTDTFALGNAGIVTVSANTISVDGLGSGISSSAQADTSVRTGNAGSVNVTGAGNISITNGGQIASATLGSGNAGKVTVKAGTLLVDGAGSSINALADVDSSGQTGDVGVTATDSITLSNGGQLSIQNNATVTDPSLIQPTSMTVNAPRVTILNSPNAITTSSALINPDGTTSGNVAAGSITINAKDTLYLDPSGITTTSNLGDGGAISIKTGMLTLNNSQISTSVLGLNTNGGNGGNIAISANTLILNTGFIQANTAAANSSGGTVSIAAQNLIPSGNTLFLGGSSPYTYQPGVFGFNVIQAAAPTGVSGTVQTTSPALDIAGSLSGLSTQMIDTGGLGRNPCQATGGSSMSQSGRGGLPPSARGLLRAELPLSPTMTGYSSPVVGRDMRIVLSGWSCS